MQVCKTINIDNHSLINGLLPVLEIISLIDTTDDDSVELDFSHTSFISPLFVLSLIVYISSCHKKITIVNLPDYLRIIGFANGIQSDLLRSTQFGALLEKYARKTYIPIINFPAKNNRDDERSIFCQLSKKSLLNN